MHICSYRSSYIILYSVMLYAHNLVCSSMIQHCVMLKYVILFCMSLLHCFVFCIVNI